MRNQGYLSASSPMTPSQNPNVFGSEVHPGSVDYIIVTALQTSLRNGFRRAVTSSSQEQHCAEKKDVRASSSSPWSWFVSSSSASASSRSIFTQEVAQGATKSEWLDAYGRHLVIGASSAEPNVDYSSARPQTPSSTSSSFLTVAYQGTTELLRHSVDTVQSLACTAVSTMTQQQQQQQQQLSANPNDRIQVKHYFPQSFSRIRAKLELHDGGGLF
eukprot:PhM_4_TR10203/c0_g2_i1/m.40885